MEMTDCLFSFDLKLNEMKQLNGSKRLGGEWNTTLIGETAVFRGNVNLMLIAVFHPLSCMLIMIVSFVKLLSCLLVQETVKERNPRIK